MCQPEKWEWGGGKANWILWVPLETGEPLSNPRRCGELCKFPCGSEQATRSGVKFQSKFTSIGLCHPQSMVVAPAPCLDVPWGVTVD